MKKNRTYNYLAVLIIFYSFLTAKVTHAASFEWTQTDWGGGASPLSAQHPDNQAGWDKFSISDLAVDASSPGQISVRPLSSTKTDTEFLGGISDNITRSGTGTDAYIELTGYPLSFGTGADGQLLVNGKIASGSTDGLVHPRPLSPPAGLTFSTGASGNIPSATYYYRVTAFNSVGESTPILASYYLDTGNRSIRLSWDPVPCADGYRIYGRGRFSRDENYGPLTTVSVPQTSWEDNNIGLTGVSISFSVGGGVIPPGSYFYKVTAYNDNGETVIALANVSFSYTSSVTISWTPVTWAKGYKIYGRPSSASDLFGFLATTTANTWTDTGVNTPDTTRGPEENNVSDASYLIDTVKNYSSVRVENCGAISSTAGRPMSPPQNVSVNIASGIDGPDGTFNYVVTAVDPYGFETTRSTMKGITVSGTNAVQVSWDAVTGATGYRVYRSTTSSFPASSLVCASATTLCIDSAITPSYGAPHINVSSLPTPSASSSSAGGSIGQGIYFYALTALDTSGFETITGPQRSIVVSGTAGTSSVALSWSAVPEASGYRIYRTTTSGLYNSPSLVCKVDNPAILSCQDTLSIPLSGAPSRSYDNALTSGRLEFKVNGEIYVDSSSAIYMDAKGSPGGGSLIMAGVGQAGRGLGAGGDRGAGASYGTAGSNNSSGTGNIGYPYGDNFLTMIFPGSGGASGSIENFPGISGRGGASGGVIRIFADTINIPGEIDSNGFSGRNGAGYYADGGGGGSGGTILIGGHTVLLGSISAIGGTGGLPGYTRYTRYTKGGSGGDGRIRIVSDNIVSGDISPLPYTGNRGSFESQSFQLDSGGVSFSAIRWSASVPANSTLKFQIATNKDNTTWNFLGPDGAPGSYYTVSGTTINPSHNGDRFLKYKVYMDSLTTNPLDSPVVSDVSIDYLYTPRYQTLVSSPFNTNATANSITRVRWSEGISAGADVVLQMRTSVDGTVWSSWFGPHNTTFSASAGIKTITVASATGFTVGSSVTLTNSANPGQVEVKKISTISGNIVTLDSNTTYSYAAGSIFSDTYTDPSGSEPVNSLHKDGVSDRWQQYRIYLFSDSSTAIPYLFESTISYGNILAVYKPDGVIDSNGNNIYGSAGSGLGGSSPKSTNPAVQVVYNLAVQNDGNVDSVDDFFEITWNIPYDVSGIWSVVLNDGVQDFTPAMMPVVTERIPFGGSKGYTVKATPSPNAPPATKDVIIDIHSKSDYGKVDSVKATININTFFKADGIIDGNGDNSYDPNRTGGGGTSTRQTDPGNTISYDIRLQNEGNVSDTYTLSLNNAPLTGWKVFINDGSKDYDIADPSKGFTTPGMPSPPDAGSTKSYTLKVIPIGSPTTQNVILNIYSNGAAKYADSLTATVVVNPVLGIDGIINGHGDDIRGAIGSGAGGFTSKDIPAGASDNVIVGIQNEGNVADSYIISWALPSGWPADSIVLTDPLLDGPLDPNLTCTSPCTVPAIFIGDYPKYSGPDKYNPGEVPPFTFSITTPLTYTSETIIFNIQSMGNETKVDSVKAVINSKDTTPPASRTLSIGSKTAISVQVSWTAPGDDGVSGTAASYDLRYSTSPITDTNFALASKVSSCKSGESDLRRPRATGGAESCTVSRLFANTDYYFALKTTDEAGNTSAISTCSGCPARTLTSSDITRPGAITDLVVTDAAKDTVTVCWTAPADDGTTSSSGPATEYELRYSTRYIVDDGISPGAGQVTFSSATLSQDISLPKSPGEKECYVISVKNEINTGGGIIDDRTRNARFYFAIKALDEARNKSLLSNIARGLTPLVSYAYNMVSVPYVPSPNTPADVLGDDVGTPLYVYHWDSRGPNIANGCYDGVPGPYSDTGEVCNVLSSIKEGRGYFLWVPAKNVTLDVPSGSTESPAKSCVYDVVNNLSFTCYELPLQDGWNMIGIPFDREINLSNRDINGNGTIEGNERGIYVRKTTRNDVDVATLQTAVTARNWMDNDIFAYNGVNYTYEICDQDRTTPIGSGCPIVIQPWKAYWIRVHGGGGATFELLIPQ